MLRKLAPLVVLLTVSAAPAADPPPELKLLPADSAVFVHMKLAAVYDSLTGELLKSLKPEEAKMVGGMASSLSLGQNPAEVSSFTFAYPEVKEKDGNRKQMIAITYREKYDKVKRMAEVIKQSDGVALEKDGVITVTRTSDFGGKKQTTVTITDFSDPFRVVTYQGYDEMPKPGDGKGVHADLFSKHADAVVLVGVNVKALPADFLKGMPPMLLPVQGIDKAEHYGFAVGMSKDRFDVTVRVVSKDKDGVAVVEKAFETARKKHLDDIAAGMKAKDADEAKELGELAGVVEKGLKDAKVVSDGLTTTATATASRDIKVAPIVATMRRAAARMNLSNNLHQIGIAVHSYHDTHNGMPPAASADKNGKKLLSWRVAILPYLEQKPLYDKFKHDEPWDSEHNLKVLKDNPMPKVFALPEQDTEKDKKTHFQVFAGPGTAFDPAVKQQKIFALADGTSNTILAALAADAVEWTKPDDLGFDPKKDVKEKLLKKSYGYMIGFCDGSVRVLKPGVKEETLKGYITAAGGEVIKDDD